MKILFVLENYLPHIGGVEVLFKNLSEGLVKVGHDVTIVTHRLKGTKKNETINGVKVYRISCFHSRYWFTFLSIPTLLKEVKNADIIHATMFNAAFPAWFAAKIRKKTCVLTVTEVWTGLWSKLSGMNWLNTKVHELLERAIYLLPYNQYVCISKSTQKQLLSIGIDKSKTGVIYPCIDYNLFNPKKYSMQKIRKIRKKLGLKDDFVYMFYGRPGVSKGLEYLLKAVSLIAKEIPNSKMLAIISRDKAYRKRYKHMLKLIKELKIGEKIVLLDPIPRKELPKYIKAADCIVVPSLSEGFGLTAAEACAMGKPVVASNTTSLPEVVSGKYVLVRPRSPDAIAKGVEAVYRGKVKSMGKKTFRWSKVIRNYLHVYKKVIRKKV